MRKKPPNQNIILISPKHETKYNNYKTYKNIFNKKEIYQSKKNFITLYEIGELRMLFPGNNSDQISILRNLLNIYSKYLYNKKKYYFLNYYSKTVNSRKYKFCTCKSSTYENEKDNDYTNNNLNINNKRYYYATNTDNYKERDKISNVKVENFIINKENSSYYSNYVNLNKSEYFFNGNEIGSFSSYNINNKNPTKNIISVKNGSNNKKYVVKIKLYSNQSKSEVDINNSIKFKKNFNTHSNNINHKYKKLARNNYVYKNITVQNKYNNGPAFNGILSKNIYDRSNTNTLNPTVKFKDDDNISIMKDQDILDYLNTNNYEKETLIKKILYKRINDNGQRTFELKKLNNNRMINLDNMNSYSYINNNYRNTKKASATVNNYGYKNTKYITSYFDTDNINTSQRPNQYNTRKTINMNNYYENPRIIIDKRMFNSTNRRYTMRNNRSNDNINFDDARKELKTKKLNYFTNRPKKLSKINSYSNIRNNNYNINPREINIFTPVSRIIIPYQSNQHKNPENYRINCPKLNIIQKNIYARKKNFTFYTHSNQMKKEENKIDIIEEKSNLEWDRINFKIPVDKFKKMNTIGINTNIDENNKKMQKYQVNNVVNEQYSKEQSDKKDCSNHSESENLRISMQSMNDSKIMQLAKNYIKEEENPNINEINQILNSKKGGN